MSAITHSTTENCSNTIRVNPVPLNEQEYQIKNVIEEDETPVIDISPLKAYIQVTLIFFCMCFCILPFCMLGSLQTSLEGVLGSVTTGLNFFFWSIGSLLTRNIQSILGLKVTFVLCTWLTSVYVIGYVYPTWYTLVTANLVYGSAVGPALSVGSVYANIIACSLAKAKGKDPKQYVGVLQGVISIGGLFSGAVLGNSLSSLIIFLSEPKIAQNMTLMNSSNTESNVCQLESTIYSVSDRTYYILIAVAAISLLSSCCASFGTLSVPGRTYKCIPLVQVWLQTKSSLLHIVKTVFTCKYMPVFILVFYSGLESNFFISVYTKYFISDCVGIELVGVVSTLRSLSIVLASILSGKIILYVSRTGLSIATMMFTMTLLYVMLFWEREPSYVAIFLLAIGLGAGNGSLTSIAAAYLGVVGKKEAEVVFGIFWAVRGAGGAAMFFLSGFASVSVVVTILLITQAIVCLCYYCAEYFYGEMKSSNWTTPNDTINQKLML